MQEIEYNEKINNLMSKVEDKEILDFKNIETKYEILELLKDISFTSFFIDSKKNKDEKKLFILERDSLDCIFENMEDSVDFALIFMRSSFFKENINSLIKNKDIFDFLNVAMLKDDFMKFALTNVELFNFTGNEIEQNIKILLDTPNCQKIIKDSLVFELNNVLDTILKDKKELIIQDILSKCFRNHHADNLEIILKDSLKNFKIKEKSTILDLNDFYKINNKINKYYDEDSFKTLSHDQINNFLPDLFNKRLFALTIGMPVLASCTEKESFCEKNDYFYKIVEKTGFDFKKDCLLDEKIELDFDLLKYTDPKNVIYFLEDLSTIYKKMNKTFDLSKLINTFNSEVLCKTNENFILDSNLEEKIKFILTQSKSNSSYKLNKKYLTIPDSEIKDFIINKY